MKKLKTSRGLSLLEILIAIVILGFLVLASMVVISPQLVKGRDAKRKADLEKIKTALYDYFFDQGCFPKIIPECGQPFGEGRGVPYLEFFPCDSKGIPYGYQVEKGDCPQAFKILANLENLKDFGIAKVGCHFGCGLECDYNYGLASSNINVYEDCIIYYACTPSKQCVAYEDPVASQCPKTFENDPACNNECNDKKVRCHDERGKQIPE